ncbi:MAG: hypothetical protein NTX50_04625 [Candidatus Sumerlaeota bacterium]|nr:hypothetical protein [Candidatus Sumerlaeota bacterium]
MHLIANVPVKKSPCEIQDDHYYNSPEWFRKSAGIYDKRDRSAPKVFVGEYACTAGVGKGNLKGALAEAAFMMGFERNSESIFMASYAPLFYHIKDRKWPVNLIGFDASRCFGTPSYYTQVLMAQNRGDVVLPSKMESAEEKFATTIERGAIGLGTWLTKAEYKDIKVAQGDKVLYESDFTKGAQGWRVLKGDWKAVEGVYRQSSDGDDMRAVCGDANWTDYVLTLKARKISGAEGFLIMFRVKDNANWLWLNIGGWSNSVTAIERCFRGEKSRLPGDGPGGIQTGRWYDIKLDVKGSRVECFLDGKSIITIGNMYDEKTMTAMNAVAARVEKTGEILVKVANFTDQPQKTAVKLNGAGKIAPEGIVTVLTSAKVEDENTVEEPTKVAPVTQKAKGLGPEFEYTFAPNSLTILRLQAK